MSEDSVDCRFGRFEVRPDQRQLLADGQPVKLGSRAFDLLRELIARRERVVSKNELIDLVWPGVSVEEGNLQVQMTALRKILGADAIATIPGRGYKFAANADGRSPIPAPARLRPATGESAPSGPGPLSSLAPLFGRDKDVAALSALLARRRLVSIVGPAGIGKTRVAQAVLAARLTTGGAPAFLVELAPLDDPALVVSTIARALGQTPDPTASALASLVEAMREQSGLLLLDNCEQVASAVAEIAAAILAQAPKIQILATSQEPLHLADEQVWRLAPLDIPPSADSVTARDYGAVALFVARARAADARFELNEENVEAVVDICRKLDGIALAIEFAAARVSLLGVQTLRRRLGERLSLLSGGAREALARHRTLRAALEWSYGLLPEHERSVLDRLGIFTGGFSLELAQSLIHDKDIDDKNIDEWTLLDALSTLIDKSLVMVDAGEPPRYRLLETTRAFALERLAASDQTQAMRRRHAQTLIAIFQSVGMIEGPTARIARTSPELDNLRAAAAWATGPGGDLGIAIELAGEADFLWYVLGLNAEGVRMWRAAEAWIDAATPPRIAARFWLTRSILQTLNELRHQADAARRSADIYRKLGDREGLFTALTFLAVQSALMGEGRDAEAALSEAKSLLDPAWPVWTVARVEFIMGYINFFCARDPEAAAECIRIARALFRREGGDAGFGAEAEMSFVLVQYARRKFAETAELAATLLRRPTTGLVGYTRAIVAVTLGAALAGKGDVAASEAIFRQALPGIKRATGTVSWALNHVAFLLAMQDRKDDAARLLGHIDAARGDEMIVQSPSQKLSYDEAESIARQALGGERFSALRAQGRRLSEDEATTLAFPER